MRQQPTKRNGHYTSIEAWNSDTGASLAVYHRKADARPIGVVHINHGLADHAGRYGRFAEVLSKAGFEVYAHDHRGHGATIAPDASQGVFSDEGGWNKVLGDIKFVNAKLREAHPKLPLIMFGHSMGGMLTYNYLLRWSETIDGAAVWNAGMSKSPLLSILKFVLDVENKFKGPKTLSIASKFSFEAYNKAFKPNQTDADWLTKDLAEAKAYDGDPDCGWRPSNSMWRDVAEGIDYGANDIGLGNVRKDLPIYLLGGDQDPSIEKGKSIRDLDKRLKAAGIANLMTWIRNNGRHEALNEPEAERNEVMDTFVDWAKSAVSANT